MNKTMDDRWLDVAVAVEDARAIAFDTCHKIYILMDDRQVEEMKEYDYDPLITKDQMDSSTMLITLRKWFSESCPLRFINAVRTVSGNPNDGYENLIPQGAEEELFFNGWDDDYDS